jgi:branched-chain amino acid transport system permease protein
MNLVKFIKLPLLSLLALLFFAVVAELTLDGFVQLLLTYVVINMILAMSLNLVNGYTGQFSLGHAGFMAVGAYFSAWLSTHVPMLDGPLQFLNFVFYALAGGCLAAFAGYLVGLPSLRLKGDYLAIVTLGFGEIIRVMILNTPAVGGARGFAGIPGPQAFDVGGFEVSGFLVAFSHGSFWLLATFFVIWRLMEGAHGRTFLSVREDEIAAEAMGVNTTQAKVKAFVLSSFFAGVAGSIFAHYASYLNPASFNFQRSVDAVIMVVLGGMGSMSGALIAAVFITLMPEILRPLQEIIGVDIRMIIYSLMLILLMILRPEGIFGKAELPDLFKKCKKKSSQKQPEAT